MKCTACYWYQADLVVIYSIRMWPNDTWKIRVLNPCTSELLAKLPKPFDPPAFLEIQLWMLKQYQDTKHAKHHVVVHLQIAAKWSIISWDESYNIIRLGVPWGASLRSWDGVRLYSSARECKAFWVILRILRYIRTYLTLPWYLPQDPVSWQRRRLK